MVVRSRHISAQMLLQDCCTFTASLAITHRLKRASEMAQLVEVLATSKSECDPWTYVVEGGKPSFQIVLRVQHMGKRKKVTQTITHPVAEDCGT